jgi:hypothetical protein
MQSIYSKKAVIHNLSALVDVLKEQNAGNNRILLFTASWLIEGNVTSLGTYEDLVKSIEDPSNVLNWTIAVNPDVMERNKISDIITKKDTITKDNGNLKLDKDIFVVLENASIRNMTSNESVINNIPYFVVFLDSIIGATIGTISRQ